MSQRAWMPMYWADYLADTSHLDAAEHGAYLLLIGHYWVSGKALPDSGRRLARIARMTEEQWSETREVLEEFFEIHDGVWVHPRIEEELQDAREKYERRAEAGRKGGKAKAKSKPRSSNAKAMPEQCLSDEEAGLNQPQPQPPIPSESKDSSGEPPGSADEEWVWKKGLPYLKANTPEGEKTVRSMVGEWLKENEAEDVRKAIETAQVSANGRPINYVMRTLQNWRAERRAGVPKGRPGGAIAPPPSDDSAILEELEKEFAG